MSAVTKQEIIEALRGDWDDSARLWFADRLEEHGIAPPDGMVLVKDNPVAWWNGEGKICKQAVKDWDAKTGGTMSIGFDIPLYAETEVKP